MSTTTESPAESPPRVLSLSEAGELLHMKRPNVAKFLARRGVRPAIEKASGYFWWEADILRVKAEREADEERMRADAQRRRTARARAEANGDVAPAPPPPEMPRLGRTQRDLMTTMLRHPVYVVGSERFALLRLVKRGLVRRLDDDARGFTLTDEGRRVAAGLD